jgi:hypothetical protein
MRYALAGFAIWLATCGLPELAFAQDLEVAPVRVRVTDSFGDALAGARVGFPDLGLFTESDRSGVASFDAVPIGDRALQVTRLGFATASQVVSVTAGALVEAQIPLTLQPLEVEGVYVNAQRQWSTTLEFNGFAERARLGFGRQLDRTAVRRGNLFRLDRAIEYAIPRHCRQDFAPTPLRGEMGARRNRADPDFRDGPTTPSGAPPIPTQSMGMGVSPIVFLDGVRYPYNEMKDIPLDWVEGVEVYSTFAGLPAKYAGLAPCGAIFVWTG